jgi:hypothetical protein
MHTETRNAEQIWRYIFRALGAVFSFFMYDTYQQVREIKTGVDDLKIMVAETKKDVQFQQERFSEFKSEIDRRVAVLEIPKTK